MNFAELATILRQRRIEKNISQQQMAEHIGVSRATINAFENARSADIGLRKVLKIIDYLGYEVAIRDKSPFPTFEELLREQTHGR
jgi:transcriptional regulator with XRE-family HTH domain